MTNSVQFMTFKKNKKLGLASSVNKLLTHALPGLVSMVMRVYSVMFWHLGDVNATFNTETEY